MMRMDMALTEDMVLQWCFNIPHLLNIFIPFVSLGLEV